MVKFTLINFTFAHLLRPMKQIKLIKMKKSFFCCSFLYLVLSFSTPQAGIAQDSPSPAIVRGFDMTDRLTQKDCMDAKSWGANVVRMQMFIVSYAADKHQNVQDALPSYLDYLESKIKYIQSAGLKVVVDMQQAPLQKGGRSDQPAFWNRPDLEQSFCDAWTAIATRLLPYKDVIWGYDLFNEPLDRSQLPSVAKEWRPLAIKIIQAIRKVDANTWLIFEPGPGGLCGGFGSLTPLPDSHIVYSGHFYYPQAFTHQGVSSTVGTDLASAKLQTGISYPSIMNGQKWDKQQLERQLKAIDNFQAKYKVPIYIGEFSVIRWAPDEAAKQWLTDVISLFEAREWSWTYHSFREWQGWSLEHDDRYWQKGAATPQMATSETDRAKIIKRAFSKN